MVYVENCVTVLNNAYSDDMFDLWYQNVINQSSKKVGVTLPTDVVEPRIRKPPQRLISGKSKFHDFFLIFFSVQVMIF